MEKEIKNLIEELRQENDVRATKMNSGQLTDYSHTAFVHTYNETIRTIKRLEAILKSKGSKHV